MSSDGKPTMAPRYLDVKSCAGYMSMTEWAVYAAVHRGQLPYRRMGRKVIFDTVELDRHIRHLEGMDATEVAIRRQHEEAMP